MRVERVFDDRRGDPAPVSRVRGRLEPAHDPGVPAAPHEESDRSPGLLHRRRRELERFVDGGRADQHVRPGPRQDQRRCPAQHARAATLAPIEARATPRSSELLCLQLGGCGAVHARPDHVHHHLDARADALDVVRLGDEIDPLAEVQGVWLGRRGHRGRDETEQAGEDDRADTRSPGSPTVLVSGRQHRLRIRPGTPDGSRHGPSSDRRPYQTSPRRHSQLIGASGAIGGVVGVSRTMM